VRVPRQTADEARSPARFDEMAESWQAKYEPGRAQGHLPRARLAATVRIAGRGPGDALDAGLGAGHLAAELERAGWTVWGIDASSRMVDLARARVPGPAERLTVGRLERLPYPDDRFDLVVSVGVLEYTALEDSLRELARVLRPNGRLIAGFRRAAAPVRIWRDRIVHPLVRAAKRVAPFGDRAPAVRRRAMRIRRIKRLLESLGLTIESVEPVACAPLPDPLDRLFPDLATREAERAERSPLGRRLFGLQILVGARKARGPVSLERSKDGVPERPC
jgi:SAM-dependent methyltransferase